MTKAVYRHFYAQARQTLYASLRKTFTEWGYLEVETPVVISHAGIEPHIEPFQTQFHPETDVGRAATFFLQTSPEYAMKRLIAEWKKPIFQISKVFRNGEISKTHNPEFSMLEFYRPHADYSQIMNETESLLKRAERDIREQLMKVQSQVAWPETPVFAKSRFDRLTVKEAVKKFTSIDVSNCQTLEELRNAAHAVSIRPSPTADWNDLFFQIFLEKVEPHLGVKRPTFLIEYPSSMAALARLKPSDPSVAERVELYAKGLELANGFGELIDSKEQRARLVEEQNLRAGLKKSPLQLDEKFLAALDHMPETSGIAIGIDRVLMLILGASTISDVLLFPAGEFF